jgi:hypothetical protein
MSRRPSRAELERHIGDLAEAFGWRHHRARCPGLTRDGYLDGFPRDVLVRDGRLVFIAIRGAGALSRPEAAWAAELAPVETVEMHVIERGDLPSVARMLCPTNPSTEPRAPPAPRRAEERRPPRDSGADVADPPSRPTSQEEACKGPPAS